MCTSPCICLLYCVYTYIYMYANIYYICYIVLFLLWTPFVNGSRMSPLLGRRQVGSLRGLKHPAVTTAHARCFGCKTCRNMWAPTTINTSANIASANIEARQIGRAYLRRLLDYVALFGAAISQGPVHSGCVKVSCWQILLLRVCSCQPWQ